MSESLNKAQKRSLKARAQRLEPICQVGKQGLTEPLLQSVSAALEKRELIKVRFVEGKAQRKELARLLAERTRSHLILLVGNVAVLYRPPVPPNEGPAFHSDALE